jgi:hypothetical protein
VSYLSRVRRSSSYRQQAKRKERASGKAQTRKRAGGGTAKLDETQLTWKTRHAGPLWIHSALFNTRLSEAPWSRSSCHNPCSAWASTKWAGEAPACSRSCFGCAAGPTRDDEAPAVRWAPQRCANIAPDHERPRWGLRG